MICRVMEIGQNGKVVYGTMHVKYVVYWSNDNHMAAMFVFKKSGMIIMLVA